MNDTHARFCKQLCHQQLMVRMLKRNKIVELKLNNYFMLDRRHWDLYLRWNEKKFMASVGKSIENTETKLYSISHEEACKKGLRFLHHDFGRVVNGISNENTGKL